MSRLNQAIKISTERWASCLAYAGIVVFAVVWVWIVGHRGLMPMDHSAIFDGAWRSYQGQAIYSDYVFSRPPLAVGILWLSFHLMGVGWSAMVAPAALLNGAGAALAMWIVHLLLPRQRWLAFGAGLLTSVWFQAPFGTLWFEQTAFFFNLLALALLLWTQQTSAGMAIAARTFAGLAVGAAALSKQNAGVEFIPVAIGVVLFQYEFRLRLFVKPVVQFVSGLILAGLLLLAWLAVFSSISGFWYNCVELARAIASHRVGALESILGFFVFWLHPGSLVVLVTSGIALWKQRANSFRPANFSYITFIVLGCASYQNLFWLHTLNEASNSFPFLGLTMMLPVGLLINAVRRCVGPLEVRDTKAGVVPYLLLSLLIFVGWFKWGVDVSWSRVVHQFKEGTTFVPISIPRARGLQWGEPTPISYNNASAVVHARDFEALNQWLEAGNANFFVFPDTTILYGLHGRVSPQRWAFLIPDHSFFRSELPEVDAEVVRSLRKNDVRMIVLEKETWSHTHELLAEMTQLRGFIDTEFEKVAEFGIYEAWQIKTAGTLAGAE
jgi:hypothetical protein